MLRRSLAFIVWHFLASLLLSTANAATMTINVLDGVGEGFNDTTAVAAIGGNTGTTVGEQRLKAFQYAADAIGAYLESNVTIIIDAQFAGLSCTASSGVLGSAGSKSAFRDFSNAPLSNTFYPGALANALAGSDLDASQSDIVASFNGDVGSAGCLESLSWYYGFDHNEPSGSLDFVAVLTHELLHGLGFISFASVTTGEFLDSNNPTFAGIFDTFIFDAEQAKLWGSMTNAERVSATINDPNLAWKGDNVTAAALYLTNGTKTVDLTIVNASPITLKGDYVRLYAPNPVEQGSSVSHFTTDASPNLLMEPAINSDLFSSTIDLSQQLLKDIGWPFQTSHLSDISVTLNSSVTEVLLGNSFDYTIVVSNNAQADADLIKTKIVLAAGVSYQSFSGSGWTCAKTAGTSPEEVICELNSAIANGASSTALTLVVSAPASGSGTLESSVTAATITTEFNATNNTASQSVALINNHIPVASNASLSTTAGTVLAATLSATDADSSDNLTFSIVSNGTKGTAVITDAATGAFTYTPADANAGQDSFTFKVNDGLVDSNIATVTLALNVTQTTTSVSGEEIAVSTSADGATITALEALDETTGLVSEQIATKPVDTTFPHGFIAYKVEGVTVGATVTIDIVFPSIPDNPKLYKVDATNGFVEFTNFSINSDTNTITITLVDGGTGDADGIANGIIDDPLGLAEAPVVTGGNSLSGGGGSMEWLFIINLLLLYVVRRYLSRAMETKKATLSDR